jgi:glycine cleavage system H lipoate-binding protein
MTYEFLSIYPAKLMEYGLAVTYLLLFVPMWRYVQGGRREAVAQAARGRRDAERWPAVAVAAPWPSLGWFQVPAGVALHPGHTWARVEADGTVAVGVDDFAQRLVAPTRIDLPRPGALVSQGEAAVGLGDGRRSVPLVSPVNGTVVAVNRAVAEAPELLKDAYGAGWLFKVQAPRLEADQRQLLHAQSARHFLDGEAEALAMRASPEVGQVLQDGGVPVDGLARALAGDVGWEALAREFFHTEKGTP